MHSNTQMKKMNMYYIQIDDNKNGVLHKPDMLLQLPQDETTVLRVKQWLMDHKITYKEETLNVYGTNAE